MLAQICNEKKISERGERGVIQYRQSEGGSGVHYNSSPASPVEIPHIPENAIVGASVPCPPLLHPFPLPPPSVFKINTWTKYEKLDHGPLSSCQMFWSKACLIIFHKILRCNTETSAGHISPASCPPFPFTIHWPSLAWKIIRHFESSEPETWTGRRLKPVPSLNISKIFSVMFSTQSNININVDLFVQREWGIMQSRTSGRLPTVLLRHPHTPLTTPLATPQW